MGSFWKRYKQILTMNSFEIALQKGEIGENIIREYLESKGWIVYFPYTKNKAHAFDILATKNKEKIIALDVKTKARLNKWKATGINIKSYKQYLSFKKLMSIDFYIFFVDDKTGDVHKMLLNENLKAIYPTPYLIAWFLDDMEYLFNIGEENIKKISLLDQRNYLFNPIL
jgi:hypothetical protein